MFGLMKPRGCGHKSTAESAVRRRLHYCGTCKTMGRLYGQRSRMLLNNDAVFLAELLTSLGPDRGSVSGWGRPYQSYNCASLPSDEMPIALQYASAATLVMSEMKLRDQIDDCPKSGFKVIGRIYSDSFARASAHLKQWDVPMDSLWSWYRTQQVRETETSTEDDRSQAEILGDLAQPTAEITGLVFQHGAQTLGLDETVQEQMLQLGRQFGSLVYLLDAFEDDAKDARRGEFNALQAAFGANHKPLNVEQRGYTIARIQSQATTVEAAILDLPLEKTTSDMFVQRLTANIADKLGLPRRGTCCAHSVGDQSKRAPRWALARITANRITAQHRTECAGLVGTIKAPIVFATVLLAAMLFPKPASAAANYRECAGVLFNLMFWGAAFNAILVMPQRLVPALRGASPKVMSPMDGGIPHSSSGGGQHTTVVTTTRVRRRPPCCFGCDCDCCCDGCCEACDCACCSCCTCEACDCANCACDSCSGC